ncbi:MAG: hypothetical protein ACOY93_14790 [Bacillota bacterium]
MKTERIDDATYMVTDPRFTHQPEAQFPSGRKFPDPERLLGPLAILALAEIVLALLIAGASRRSP